MSDGRDEAKEVWEYDPRDDGSLWTDDGDIIADYVSDTNGRRIAALPALERLVRKYMTQHDAFYGGKGRRCGCGWCCEARELLGEPEVKP